MYSKCFPIPWSVTLSVCIIITPYIGTYRSPPFLSCLVARICLCTVKPFDSAMERVALEAFFNSTGGKHWIDSPGNGWLHDPCHCQWTRVTCVDEKACDDSPVIEIENTVMVFNAIARFQQWYPTPLSGVLPSWNGDPGQGALPHLQNLDLEGPPINLNNGQGSNVRVANPLLTGTLPDAWGNMVQLTSLQMGNLNLEGTLPKSWGNMTAMEKMDL